MTEWGEKITLLFFYRFLDLHRLRCKTIEQLSFSVRFLNLSQRFLHVFSARFFLSFSKTTPAFFNTFSPLFFLSFSKTTPLFSIRFLKRFLFVFSPTKLFKNCQTHTFGDPQPSRKRRAQARLRLCNPTTMVVGGVGRARLDPLHADARMFQTGNLLPPGEIPGPPVVVTRRGGPDAAGP
jgi:hypothetical protein